jgi:hypothetical protein
MCGVVHSRADFVRAETPTNRITRATTSGSAQ